MSSMECTIQRLLLLLNTDCGGGKMCEQYECTVASYPAVPAFFRLQEEKAFFYCKRKKMGRLGSRLSVQCMLLQWLIKWMCEKTRCVMRCCNGCEYGWYGM